MGRHTRERGSPGAQGLPSAAAPSDLATLRGGQEIQGATGRRKTPVYRQAMATLRFRATATAPALRPRVRAAARLGNATERRAPDLFVGTPRRPPPQPTAPSRQVHDLILWSGAGGASRRMVQLAPMTPRKHPFETPRLARLLRMRRSCLPFDPRRARKNFAKLWRRW
jgi:predicted lipid-binding transport protein (Tim44 family)